MSRILAIDYGSKRIGVATSDPSKIIATPLCTIKKIDIKNFLIDYDKKEFIEEIVIGISLNLKREQSPIFYEIKNFTQKLSRFFPAKKILNFNERFTSIIARRDLVFFKYNKKDRQNLANIDMISAALILQDYLDLQQKIKI